MTGIPLFDAVFNFMNFLRMLAGIGITSCIIFFASVVIGVMAPNSSWGNFVDRYWLFRLDLEAPSIGRVENGAYESS